MTKNLVLILIFLSIGLFCIISSIAQENPQSPNKLYAGLVKILEQEYPSLEKLYRHFHANPELSFFEEKTSARLADELEKIGFDVTQNIGGYGIVGVLKNGNGPTVMVRADMDALPVTEQTGLAYASKVRTKDGLGNEVSVMHACGHDVHMTVLTGTARLLFKLKNDWKGTLLLVGQPAEETGGGAKAMLADGLFQKFPRPDFCLALHVSPNLPAGSVGVVEGYALANVDAVDITIRGVGGHGAIPNSTIDPIVIAARVVVALQTIVSRELPPIEPAVVTVGSIHGGTKHNIIPEQVLLQLTVRSYSDEVRENIFKALERIINGIAKSAGISDDNLPSMVIGDEYTPATYNDPELTQKIARVCRKILGEKNVFIDKPIMAGEDFGRYGKQEPAIPISLFWLGTVNHNKLETSRQTGKQLPSLHSSVFAPDEEPTIKCGIKAMTAAVLELMKK